MSGAPLFDAFDRVRIVNLQSRTDRRAEMERELRRVGMAGDGKVAFFPAIVCPDPGPFRRIGSHGNFLARIRLLEEAAAANESVLILEDDCDFIAPALRAYRMPAHWDIFYGGYHALDPDDPDRSDIIGSHFMGFSARAAHIAADYLTRYLQPDFPIDAQAAAEPGFDPAIRPPIDGAFVWMRRAHPELTTAFAMLGVQRRSRTDVGDQHPWDRVPVLRSLAALLRRLRNRLSGRYAAMKPDKVAFGARNLRS